MHPAIVKLQKLKQTTIYKIQFNKIMMRYFIFLLILQSCAFYSYSKSIIRRLPGYPGDLPFKLETGYVAVGGNEDVQLFYYFVESTGNPKEDPLIFQMAGGPGASALFTFLYEIGPLSISLDLDNQTLSSSPDGWTQMANIIFVDIPAGAGFSYSETNEGWINSDTILAKQAVDFIRKFVRDHPKFSTNPLYIGGISYVGIVVPKITLDLYEGNERGDQPPVNIQGYMLTSPFTDKFMDFNSRLEYAHRMALISDDIYKSALASCNGNYVDTNSANSECLYSLQRFEECTSRVNLENILEPFCDETTQNCERDINKALNKWANSQVVQDALNIRPGKIGEWNVFNSTMHYRQGKNDSACYTYDFYSSYSYHKKLTSKNCRALILSGDHDFTFPYVGTEQWINSLNLQVDVPWNPFYVDGQVGGYETKYVQDDYSLTFSTIKGAGHLVEQDKPHECMVLAKEWLSAQTYSSAS